MKEIEKEDVSKKEKILNSTIKNYSIVIVALMLITGGLLYRKGLFYENSIDSLVGESNETQNSNQEQKIEQASQELIEKVIPSGGVELPVTWGDLGKQLIQTGVIDRKKFDEIYKQRGGLSADEKKLIEASGTEKIVINEQNASLLLNLFWALGLGNKNAILEDGPMTDKQYGGAGGFASTGGWSIAKGDPMDHYSKHEFIKLNSSQQAIVEKVSKGIYRPCCNNSTYFPDCNHGMAMLGILELMAKQGATEKEMYKVALQVNSYWFGDTYLTLASYFEKNGTAWESVDPEEVLGINYSSASGYKKIASKINPIQRGGGKGCGV